MSSIVSEKPKLSVKVQSLSVVTAIVGAVALPQLFHAMGAVSGLGTSLGETFLPMHLPIILAGLFAGPYVGAIAGLLSPLVSFAVSGMPSFSMIACGQCENVCPQHISIIEQLRQCSRSFE